MAKTLEKRLRKGKQIRKQFDQWESHDYEHTGYYFANMVRILFGREPSHVSPYNRIVNADLGDY